MTTFGWVQFHLLVGLTVALALCVIGTTWWLITTVRRYRDGR